MHEVRICFLQVFSGRFLLVAGHFLFTVGCFRLFLAHFRSFHLQNSGENVKKVLWTFQIIEMNKDLTAFVKEPFSASCRLNQFKVFVETALSQRSPQVAQIVSYKQNWTSNYLNCMIKVKNRSLCKIHLKSIIKRVEWRRWPAKVFSVNFSFISTFALEFPFFTLIMSLKDWVEQQKQLLRGFLWKRFKPTFSRVVQSWRNHPRFH